MSKLYLVSHITNSHIPDSLDSHQLKTIPNVQKIPLSLNVSNSCPYNVYPRHFKYLEQPKFHEHVDNLIQHMDSPCGAR